MKKLLIVAALLVAASLCFASGGQEKGAAVKPADKVAPMGVFPIVSKPITLTFYKEGNFTDEQLAALGTNGVIKYYADKTNITMKFIFLNPTDGKTKMILSFAAGDYPDGAILDWNTIITRPDVMQYGTKEKILLPLNKYIDQYGDELKKIFALRPTYKGLITAPDGNIYGMPRFSECFHCLSYPKLWFNYNWLDKLGLKEPQTTDELYTVLKAFKTKDPNGNGKADEIPLTGGVEWSCALEYYLMNSFIDTPAASSSTNPRPFVNVTNGKVAFVADKGEYKQGLIWLKKLYSEGLIDPGNFTNNYDQLVQTCRAEPLVVGGYTTDHMTMGVDFFASDHTIADMYHALPPVAGPAGARFQPLQDFNVLFNGFHFVLFDKCSNPDAAYRLADFMLSEYNMFVNHYGVEGIGWNAPADKNLKNVDGGPVKCVPVSLATDAPQADKDRLANNQFWMSFMGDLVERRAMWSEAATPKSLQTNYETRLDVETRRTMKYWPKVALPHDFFMAKETSEEFATLKTNLVNHVVKNTGMFITGSRSLDEWDQYVAELKKFGVDRYVQIYQQGWETMQKNK